MQSDAGGERGQCLSAPPYVSSDTQETETRTETRTDRDKDRQRRRENKAKRENNLQVLPGTWSAALPQPIAALGTYMAAMKARREYGVLRTHAGEHLLCMVEPPTDGEPGSTLRLALI